MVGRVVFLTQPASQMSTSSRSIPLDTPRILLDKLPGHPRWTGNVSHHKDVPCVQVPHAELSAARAARGRLF